MARVLAFGCPHLPFEKEGYLEWLIEMKNKWKCNKVVCLGDLVDNHSISYHEHDPNGWSPNDEMEATDKHLARWFKAFPSLVITRGNHDNLVDRKGKTVGLPKRCFQPFRKIWKLPTRWKDCFEVEIDGVLYKHGVGFSGKYGHMSAASDAGQSTVIAHLHSILGIQYMVTNKTAKFGLCVGCGIDRRKYAFAYGKDMRRKPIIGAGIILDGETAFVERMPL